MGKKAQDRCRMSRKTEVLGRELRIDLYDTGDGLNVLIEGGDRGHIGAVAVAAPQEELRLIVFPGHREDVICRQWAETLAKHYPGPVVVEAGVHYDGIGRREIEEILAALQSELDEVLTACFAKP